MATNNNQLDYIQERVDVVADRVAVLGTSVETFKTTFEHHIEKDEIAQKDVSRLADILSDNTASLREHMRRTDLLEEYVKNVDARFTPVELEQIRKKAVSGWIKKKLKFIATLGAAVAALGTLGVAAREIIIYILTH